MPRLPSESWGPSFGNQRTLIDGPQPSLGRRYLTQRRCDHPPNLLALLRFAGAAAIQVITVRNYQLTSTSGMIEAYQINSMQRGDIAVIVAVDRHGRDPASAQRLHEMGFDEGVDIELLHRAPISGDPLAVRVGNMTVALRLALAALVEIAPLAALETNGASAA